MESDNQSDFLRSFYLCPGCNQVIIKSKHLNFIINNNILIITNERFKSIKKLGIERTSKEKIIVKDA